MPLRLLVRRRLSQFALLVRFALLDCQPSKPRPVAAGETDTATPIATGPIAVLSGGGPLPWIIINAVIGRYGPVTVLEETPEPNTLLFRRRLKKFGAVEVGGQLAFGMLQRALRLTTRRRLAEIVATHRFVSPSLQSAQSTRRPAGVSWPASRRRARDRYAHHWPRHARGGACAVH